MCSLFRRGQALSLQQDVFSLGILVSLMPFLLFHL
jgi:hypothetical protein